MKKQILKIITSFLGISIILAGCNQNTHKHEYADYWSYDEAEHWHRAVCEHYDLRKDVANHEFSEYKSDHNATETKDGTKTRICSVCFYEDIVIDEGSKITYSEEWTYDETFHWHAGNGEYSDHIKSKDWHEFSVFTSNKDATTEADGTKSRTCSVCKYVETVTDEGSKLCAHDYKKKDGVIGVEQCLKCKEYRPVPEGFVEIKAAIFKLGSGAGNYNNKPVTEVTITKDYYICDHEVTQAEYKSVMGFNYSNFSSDSAAGEIQENRPVERVRWYEAIVYCNKLSILTGYTPCYKLNGSVNPEEWGSVPVDNGSVWESMECDFSANGFRLPTEAEWEMAARAGDNTTDADLYSGTKTKDELGNYAWISSNSAGKTHEVKKKTPNAFNLYDMSGNVCEWVWNNWIYDHSGIEKTDPKGSSGVNHLRVYRGGDYSDTDYALTVFRRDSKEAAARDEDIGMRLVRTAR